jgi:hypothetical protein
MPSLWRDLTGVRRPFREAGSHLKLTLDWLKRAAEAVGGEGISAHYSVGVGWGSAYPETTGYIIPTLFDAADRLRRPELAETAMRSASWLLKTQRPSGGFPGGEMRLGLEEVVFNTGQILRGLLAAWSRSGRKEFLDSAIRGADWLCSIQDADGAWRKFTSPFTTTCEHSYDVLAAWGLYLAGKGANRNEYRTNALRQYRWALAQQRENGFFEHASFERDIPPLTHSLAYVAEGTFEIARETGDPQGMEACGRLLKALERRFPEGRELPGRIDAEFMGAARWSCVTGNIQFGLMAVRWGREHSDQKLVSWGERLIESAAATQIASSPDDGVRGAVFGSKPIYGGYFPFTALNWAAKYLVDALMELSEIPGS